MKIAELPIRLGSNFILEQLQKIIKAKYIVYKNKINKLLSAYNEEDIELSIKSIYIVNRTLYIPSSGKAGIILRYLEYGGAGIPSYKIISTSARQISRKLVGDSYVF